jgi:hypothetical protein
MTVDVPSIKVTVPIEGSKLPREILPPEGTPGSAKALVSFRVKAGEIELSASLKAKSYRDVLNKVDAAPHGAFAILQGKLGAGFVLQEAGFTVQAIIPKEVKAET